MKILFSLLFSTSTGKVIYSAAIGISAIEVLQDVQLNQANFFDAILNSVPATITTVLGIVWGVVLVAGAVDDKFTKWQQNRIKIKIKNIAEIAHKVSKEK